MGALVFDGVISILYCIVLYCIVLYCIVLYQPYQLGAWGDQAHFKPIPRTQYASYGSVCVNNTAFQAIVIRYP